MAKYLKVTWKREGLRTTRGTLYFELATCTHTEPGFLRPYTHKYFKARRVTDESELIAGMLNEAPRITDGEMPFYDDKIGVSAIVEGSDAEVPLEWIDLARYCDDEKYKGDLLDLAEIAVKDFDKLCQNVNDEACRLWDEANSEGA